MTLRAFTLPVVLLAASCQSPGVAAVYYVDYSGGSDTANGTSPATPWQHAPGDPAAQGGAANARLAPGDIVRFKGGVAYRGSIRAAADGAAGRPITYTGTGYGNGTAIIEGADPVTAVAPCTSAAACGGAANWQKLSAVTFTPPATDFIKFYDTDGILFESQSPSPPDPFFSDETASFAVSPLADKAMIEAGRINAPTVAKLLGGVPSGTLQIWTFGNLVARRQVTGIDGNSLLFEPAGIRLYSDRPGRFALTGAVAAIAGPGQYAVAGPGRAIVWTRPKTDLLVGNGRGGFDLTGRSFITISGFVFQHQTAAANGRSEGAAITRAGRQGSGLIVDGNRFENASLWDGKGVITLSNIDTVIISNNSIANIERGSGMRVGANTRAITVTGNSIDNVGRTGIAFLGAADSVIADNVITNLRGVHGNGISLYLANRRIKVINNRILATDRPMTFHGDRNFTAPGDHDFLIERNIFIATETGQAALTSWGAKTRGVTIRNNVLVGRRAGIVANESDVGVSIINNNLSGIVFNRVQGADWTIGKNATAAGNLRYIPDNQRNNSELCRSASVPEKSTLGGLTC